MTLTTFTTILWLFLIAMWALSLYGVICCLRDLDVVVEGDDDQGQNDDDDGIGPLSGPGGPIDWDAECRREQTREREMV